MKTVTELQSGIGDVFEDDDDNDDEDEDGDGGKQKTKKRRTTKLDNQVNAREDKRKKEAEEKKKATKAKAKSKTKSTTTAVAVAAKPKPKSTSKSRSKPFEEQEHDETKEATKEEEGKEEEKVVEKKKRKSSLSNPVRLSDELTTFLGYRVIPRTQVTKLMWKYIKEHNLQDPSNKKIILCDDKLEELFQVKQFEMFKMASFLKDVSTFLSFFLRNNKTQQRHLFLSFR